MGSTAESASLSYPAAFGLDLLRALDDDELLSPVSHRRPSASTSSTSIASNGLTTAATTDSSAGTPPSASTMASTNHSASSGPGPASLYGFNDASAGNDTLHGGGQQMLQHPSSHRHQQAAQSAEAGAIEATAAGYGSGGGLSLNVLSELVKRVVSLEGRVTHLESELFRSYSRLERQGQENVDLKNLLSHVQARNAKNEAALQQSKNNNGAYTGTSGASTIGQPSINGRPHSGAPFASSATPPSLGIATATAARNAFAIASSPSSYSVSDPSPTSAHSSAFASIDGILETAVTPPSSASYQAAAHGGFPSSGRLGTGLGPPTSLPTVLQNQLADLRTLRSTAWDAQRRASAAGTPRPPFTSGPPSASHSSASLSSLSDAPASTFPVGPSSSQRSNSAEPSLSPTYTNLSSSVTLTDAAPSNTAFEYIPSAPAAMLKSNMPHRKGSVSHVQPNGRCHTSLDAMPEEEDVLLEPIGPPPFYKERVPLSVTGDEMFEVRVHRPECPVGQAEERDAREAEELRAQGLPVAAIGGQEEEECECPEHAYRTRDGKPTLYYYCGSLNPVHNGRAWRRPDPRLAMHKQVPMAPCNRHHLLKGGCIDVACPYAHDYLLTADEITQLRINSKKSPCVHLKRGKTCPDGEEHCQMGHGCPSGSDCRYGYDCKFIAIPGMHNCAPILAPPKRLCHIPPYSANEQLHRFAELAARTSGLSTSAATRYANDSAPGSAAVAAVSRRNSESSRGGYAAVSTTPSAYALPPTPSPVEARPHQTQPHQHHVPGTRPPHAIRARGTRGRGAGSTRRGESNFPPPAFRGRTLAEMQLQANSAAIVGGPGPVPSTRRVSTSVDRRAFPVAGNDTTIANAPPSSAVHSNNTRPRALEIVNPATRNDASMNAQFQQLLLHQQQQQHREPEQEHQHQQQGHQREESGYYSQDQGHGETHGDSHPSSAPFSKAHQSHGDHTNYKNEYTHQPESQGYANNETAGGQGNWLQIEHPSPSRSSSS